MPGFGIVNVTAPNLTQLIDIANETDFTQILINVNHEVYNGYFFFAMAWVTWVILFFAANARNNLILQNLFYSGFVVSLFSIILRAIEVTENGLVRGLLTDRQMWIFPVITALLGLILWMTRKRDAG